MTIKTSVDGGVVTIESGRNNGLMIGAISAARGYLAGHITRANVADAIALSAAYLDALEQIKKLKAKKK